MSEARPSCVKGRFADGYATHQDRTLKPMILNTISEPWREVSWAQAMAFAVVKMKGIQSNCGRSSVGVATSSRCTDGERRPTNHLWLKSCGSGPDPAKPP
jgi:formate dehydrogenase major subunit